ncbi:MAG: hypothetical protein EB145_15390 [Proteobacteria bacterium]|nr:hypothetical protein [Pseudomonadota bacterium]
MTLEQLAEIRTLYRTDRIEPQHVAALLNELDRLQSNTCPYLILDDPEGIIGMVDATSEAEAWAAFQAENPGDYDGDPDDHDVVIECVSVAWCDKVVDDLCKARDEVVRLKADNERLRAMVPRLEWREGTGFVSARAGVFVAIVSGKGWELRVYLPYCTGAGDLVDRGPETGPEGKAACEAAYRRVCGLPAIPACAG